MEKEVVDKDTVRKKAHKKKKVVESAPPPLPDEESSKPITIGSYLREGREAKKLSLKAIAKQTKISATNLEYLEADMFGLLPNKTYVAGYVKSYSKLIGLDQEKCLKIFDQTYRMHVPSQTASVGVIDSAQRKSVGGPPVVGLVVTAGVVVAALLVFWLLQRSPSDQLKGQGDRIIAQEVTSSTPLRDETQASVVPENVKGDVKGETKEGNGAVEEQYAKAADKEKEVKPSEPRAEVEKEVEVKKESLATKEEENERREKITFNSITPLLYRVDKKITEEKTREFLPSDIRESVQSGKQNVYIRAVKGDSWITFKVDNKAITKYIIKKGKGLFLQGNEMRMFVGNVGAVKMFLNNNPLEMTFKSSVKSLVFPQENSKKYYIPLFIFYDSGKVETSEDFISRMKINP